MVYIPLQIKLGTDSLIGRLMLMSYIEHYPGPAAEDEFFFRKVRGEYKDILDLRIRPPALKKSNTCIAGLLVETKHFEDGTVWYTLSHILPL